MVCISSVEEGQVAETNALDYLREHLIPVFDKEKQLENSLWQEVLILFIPKVPLTTR